MDSQPFIKSRNDRKLGGTNPPNFSKMKGKIYNVTVSNIMKTLKDKVKDKLGKYKIEMKQNENNPAGLAELGVKIAGTHSLLTALYIDQKIKYAEFYQKYKVKDDKGKLLSDKFVEQLFLVTNDGADWYAVKRAIRSLELQAQTIKTLIYHANAEMRLAPPVN